MNIYTNENHEIKAINSTDDTSLIEIEIDREEVFGDKSDFMILNYCYKQDENGYSIYPASDYSRLLEEDYKFKIEDSQKKISILEAENEKLNTQLSTVRASHSDLILDLDFRVMDIEDNLGLVPMNINLFKALGEDDMNSTFMVVLDKIETGSYNAKEEIESICDRYLARGRITGEEYDMLMKALDKKESEKNEVIPEI